MPRRNLMLIPVPTRCRGCGLCELVCSILHSGEARPSASRIKIYRDRENYEFKPYVCIQCVNPRCIPVCPRKAISVDEETGAKILDETLCDGCGLCAEACPFAVEDTVIFKHPSEKFYVKCDLCYLREEGPGCIEVCPTQALTLKETGGS